MFSRQYASNSETRFIGSGNKVINIARQHFGGNGETVIDYDMIRLCQYANTHHDAVKCKIALHNKLFQHGIVLKVGDDAYDISPSFKDHLENNYIPFCKEFMDYFMAVGIVPVGIGYTENMVPVPTVLTENHFITVKYDYRLNAKKFEIYKICNRRGEPYKEPRKDKKAVIFKGYGYDPTCDGKIKSLIGSVLEKIMTSSRFTDCAVYGEEYNSKPVTITQSDKNEELSKPFSTNVNLGLFYLNSDKSQTGLRNSLMNTVEQVTVSNQWRMQYEQYWAGLISSDGKDNTPDYRNESPEVNEWAKNRVPRNPPIFGLPLPPGHTVAPVPRAVMRSDLLQFLDLEDEKICSVYGIPKLMFTGENRTVGGSHLGIQMFSVTVGAWRTRLARVMNSMFRCIYFEDICDFHANELSSGPILDDKIELADNKVEPESNKEGKKEGAVGGDKPKGDRDKILDISSLRKVIKNNEINLEFSVAPDDDSEQLLQKHLMGIISYKEFVAMSKVISGWEVTKEDKNAVAPWENPIESIKMLVERMTPETRSLFFTKYPGAEQVLSLTKPVKEDEGTKGSKTGSKKKKKKDSSEPKKPTTKEKEDKEEKKSKDKAKKVREREESGDEAESKKKKKKKQEKE